MYIYKSCFSEEINDYIEMKEKCGYKIETAKRYLKKFDIFCLDNNIKDKEFTKQYAEKLRVKPDNIKHSSFYCYVNTIKNFLTFLSLKGYNVVPPRNVSVPKEKLTPYIYSEDEIKKYFIAVDTYDYGISGSIAIIMPILFRILYCCAARIKETLCIKKQDLDLDSGVIKLTETKSRQERYIVVPEELRLLLKRYAEKTFWLFKDSSYIFQIGHCINIASHMKLIYNYHREFLRKAGIQYIGDHKGPRVHDFRHTSIVLSCKKMIDSGLDMYVALPILATWAGHTKTSSTEYYLRLTSNIFPYLKSKLENTWKNIFDNLEFPDEKQ